MTPLPCKSFRYNSTEIGYINKLDNPDNLEKIIDRLPYPSRLKWRDTVDQIIERQATDVTIRDIMKFVTAKARAASHPIFGNVNSKSSKPPHNRSRTRDRKLGGFSTHSKPQGSLTGKEKQRFIMCTSDHWLSRCEKFRKLSYEERRLFVRDKKLCGYCLYPGHFIGSCPRGSFCKVKGCTAKYSTFLHPNNAKNDQKPPNENIVPHDQQSATEKNKKTQQDNTPGQANNAYIKSSYSTSSTSVTGLASVPVRVKAEGQR